MIAGERMASLTDQDWLAPWRARLKRAAYSGFARDRWQHPADIIAALQIRPGARVADIGSGGGYFTFRLADAADPGGVVYAVDVDTDVLADLAARAAQRGADNIRP